MKMIVAIIKPSRLDAVLDGVTEGERVVSLGAYELLLSTAAGGIPAHGHGH